MHKERRNLFLAAAVICLCPHGGLAQTATATVYGQIADPTGAVIPHSSISATGTGVHRSAHADSRGTFTLRGLPPGVYTVQVTAPGFSKYQELGVHLKPGQVRQVNARLALQLKQEQVEVSAETSTVSTAPDANANAVVLQSSALRALSDDPDELLGELEALAGPTAGPNGAQVYVDGFSGGQLPPKASIREIRINSNPFSARFDSLGYGRIEILTKPGTAVLQGQIGARGNDAAFNSRSPVLIGPQPGYFSWDVQADLSGPLGKKASFSVDIISPNHQNTSIVDAIDPSSVTAATPSGNLLNTFIASPISRLDITPRIDLELGRSNTFTLRDDFSRTASSNQGVGEADLQQQAYSTHNIENDLQLSDSAAGGSRFANDFRLQYRRIRDQQASADSSPTVTVQGAFTAGGNNSGTVLDKQDDFEVANDTFAAAGKHSLNLGGRLRAYSDVNASTAGVNGAYTFASTQDYLARTPQTYAVTELKNGTARVVLFDAALYFQDDWKPAPNLTFSYGLRWESQNRIHDHSDWAPRFSIAWAPGAAGTTHPARTVIRAGYGWFYQRFTVPDSLGATSVAPYLATAIHENGVNQTTDTVTDPSGYMETSPGVAEKPPAPAASPSAQTVYSVDPSFRAALGMQAAIGVDRQISKQITANLTWLNSRGMHQYLTNNLGAPAFPTAAQGMYPATPLPAASENRMQFQSEGTYHENQIIASVSAHFKGANVSGFYSYANALGDTTGVTYVPSIAQDPGADYGPTSYDVHHQLLLLGNWSAPFGIAVSPMFVVHSGTPYNITTGSDLTGNNQFNARPAFANSTECTSGSSRYISSPWGCLDADPVGTTERIVPYGLGTGPVNVALNLHLSKAIGFGPRSKSGSPSGAPGGPPPVPSGLGLGGLSGGPGGPAPPAGASVERRYSLTFTLDAHNLLNTQNLGTPLGVLTAPSALLFHSQSLAGGPFSPPEGGNRSIFLETRFSF